MAVTLAALKSEAMKVMEQLGHIAASEYVCKRDKKSNLVIEYMNGKSIRVPVIDLRPYQLMVQVKLYIENVLRIFRVLPRRSGKEVESWTMLVEGAIETPGLYLMIYPTNVRARMVLWDGAINMPDGSSRKFLEMIPKEFVANINNQEMTVKLVNGSVIRILGSDIDPDKLRGTNPRGIVISEFAFCDPRVMHILLPILRQNGGWLILQTTFNGMNHAYALYQTVKDNSSWFCTVESVETLVDENGDRYITDEMIDEDRKSGMPEYLIQQEYYSVVQLNEETMYFATQMKYLYENDRILPELRVPNALLYTFWDIGRNDNNFILLVQFSYRGEPHVIGTIEGRNKTSYQYFDEIRKIAVRRGFSVKSHFVPHDGEKRDYNSGKDIIDAGAECGELVIAVPRPHRKIEAIQQMRMMIYNCYFDKVHANRIIECLSNYSKEFDKKSGIYKDAPLHDWSSHGVDAFQTMTLAVDARMVNEKPRDVIYNMV